MEKHEGLSVPFESLHKISLKLSNEEPISIYVPWPFLIDKFSTEPSQHENLIKLNLTKTINDPWPMADFGGRSKWDIDRLKLWVNIETVFQVRQVIRTIFVATTLTFACSSIPPWCSTSFVVCYGSTSGGEINFSKFPGR